MAIIEKSGKNQKNKGDKTMMRLLQASIEPIATHGIGSLNLSKLAKILNVDRALLAHYFKTKENLLILISRLLAYQAQSLLVEKLKSVKSEKLLYEYGRLQMEYFYQNPVNFKIWLQLFLLSVHDEEARRLVHEVLDYGNKRISEIVVSSYPQSTPAIARQISSQIQMRLFGPLFFSTIYDSQVKLKKIIKNWKAEVDYVLEQNL